MTANPEDRILSFDPGIVTGISFFVNGKLILGMIATEQIITKDSFLRGLHMMTRPYYVVIESPPPASRFNTEVHLHIHAELTRYFQVAGLQVEQVKPGQWKNHISRTEIDTGHIRDSADMARWVMQRGDPAR